MSLVEDRLAVFASPARARSLFTVRAAISSAVSSSSPRSSRPSLMWSYWRSRLLLQACCGIGLASLIDHRYPRAGTLGRRWAHGDVGQAPNIVVVRSKDVALM